MTKKLWRFLLIAVLLIIAILGCAKNPVASDNGGGNDDASSGGLTFVAQNTGVDNAVYLAKDAVGSNDLWVKVYADSISDNVFGAAFHIVFDSTKLQYVTYREGNFFSAGPASYEVSLQNNQPGTLLVGVTYFPGTLSSGDGVIVYLNFKAIGNGNSSINFEENHLQNDVPQDISVTGWYGGTVSKN